MTLHQFKADDTFARPPVRRCRRRAFTLVEIMVAVAIIIVLATLVIYGYGKMQASNRGRLTSQMLANCQGILREYDRATGMKGLSKAPIPAPGIVNEGATDRNGQAIKDTRSIMELACGIPVNQRALDQIPAASVWRSRIKVGGEFKEEGPIVLDAWNNPIIYVPAGGLQNVRVGTATKTIQAPDERAYFASAGADGSFLTGDDNVYSFQN
jgi:prepilin-type N-terminal cleavage/methylation domain-containing protein